MNLPMMKKWRVLIVCFVLCALALDAMAKNEIVADPTETEAKKKLEIKEQEVERTPVPATDYAEEIDKLVFPEDLSPRLNVKAISICGNELITSETLLSDIPAVYSASGLPLLETEIDDLFDFRVLQQVAAGAGVDCEISVRTIQAFTQYILRIYQCANYAGIYVYIPRESFEGKTKLVDDILTVQVIEAKLSEVSVNYFDPENAAVEIGYLNESAIMEWTPAEIGEVTNRKKLDDFVNLLNLNPDRYISAIISQGSEPQSLALGFNVYEANPCHMFFQIDNSGTKDRQWTPRIGYINTNFFGVDDRLTITYQAPWDNGITDDYLVFGSYDVPIWGPKLRLNLFGGYNEFDISPETGDTDFLGHGDFYGGTLRWNVFQENKWFFDITTTVTRERSKSTPRRDIGTDIRMSTWGAGVEIFHTDDMSDTFLSFKRVDSFDTSNSFDFNQSRVPGGSDNNFTILTTSAAHRQYLDDAKIQRFAGTFKWITSDERLTPSKMTAFGGMYTIRGYDEYEIVADGGIFASGQYEYDLVAKEKAECMARDEAVEGKPFLRKLAPVAFFDYGLAKIEDAAVGEHRDQELCSVGCGLLVDLGENFSGTVYYGYPLIATARTNQGKGRLNAGMMLRW